MVNNLSKNTCIKGIEIYYAEGITNVDEIIKEHKEKGEDIEIEAKSFLGKKTLHRVDNDDENSLTMAITASKKVLESCNLKGSDIDMVVFSSIFPEYLAPPSSLLIHNAINGKSSAVCYDVNLNCIGMLFSLIQLSLQMQSDSHLNKILLVGCDYMTKYIQRDTPYIDACFGDGACAMILERTANDSKIIDYKYYVGTSESLDQIVFPSCGTSKMLTAPIEERKLRFDQPNVEIDVISKHISDMLAENNLTVDDISMFCFSQLALYYIEFLKHSLSIPDEKALYIGDKIGYTATTSPFFSLYYAVKEGKVKRGDYVFIWTVGAGMQHAFALIKY